MYQALISALYKYLRIQPLKQNDARFTEGDLGTES